MIDKSTIQPLEDVVLFLIEQTSKASKRYSQQDFDERGIPLTIDQWVLLKIIHEHEGLSQKELADLSVRDAASITRTLDILEKKEWVVRQAIEGNRRQHSIHMTKEGKNFVRRVMPLVIEHRENSVKGLSKKEIAELKRMLQVMRNNME
jgi:DNA-binding MarR family transcriptional regulator